MKKIKIILLTALWFILLNFSIVLAQVEVKNEANELYKKISNIMVSGLKYEIKDGKLDVAMEYAMEILKKYPESIEAYYILEKSFFSILHSQDIQKHIKNLRNGINLFLIILII